MCCNTRPTPFLPFGQNTNNKGGREDSQVFKAESTFSHGKIPLEWESIFDSSYLPYLKIKVELGLNFPSMFNHVKLPTVLRISAYSRFLCSIHLTSVHSCACMRQARNAHDVAFCTIWSTAVSFAWRIASSIIQVLCAAARKSKSSCVQVVLVGVSCNCSSFIRSCVADDFCRVHRIL